MMTVIPPSSPCSAPRRPGSGKPGPATPRPPALWIAFALLMALPQAAPAQAVFGRIVPPGPETQTNAPSVATTVSDDGRVFVFESSATNWAPGAQSGPKIVVRDFGRDLTEIVSSNSAGVPLNAAATRPATAGDGRFVAFETFANNLGQASGGAQVVRKDRLTGQLRIASANALGEAASGGTSSGQARNPAISADGRFVAFRADAGNLLAGSNGFEQVYAKDLETGAVELVSRTAAGSFSTAHAAALTPHAISASGRFVVFQSIAANLVDGIAAGTLLVYVRDRQSGSTELVSRSSGGDVANAQSDLGAISPNGRFVVFRSFATNLGASGSLSRVYLHDRTSRSTTPLPLPVVGAATAGGCRTADVTNAGEVVFACFFSPIFDQVFLHVPGAPGTPFLVSPPGGGAPGNEVSGSSTAIDADGYSLTYDSRASNLAAGDTNGVSDVFVFADAAHLAGLFANGFE